MYPPLLYTLILLRCICIGWKYPIFFQIAYFDITYLRAFFTCVAKYRIILNPTVSQKIKIWMAVIIINYIVSHYVLWTFQLQRILTNKNMINKQNFCLLNDSHQKFVYRIRSSMMKIFSNEKGSPVAILFAYISLATVMSSKANRWVSAILSQVPILWIGT